VHPDARAAGLASESAKAEEVLVRARAARDGDAAAFRWLVEHHMRAVYALAYRFMRDHDDADDVAQETFVRAHAALERYDERYTFYTWLRTIATRVALNELAKRRRRQTAAGEAFDVAAETVPATQADPAADAGHAEVERRFATALETLPDEQRAVLALRVHDEMSYEEIATALGIPIGTVMSRLSRARAALRAAWEKSARGAA